MVNKIIRVVQADILKHTKYLTDNENEFNESKIIFRDRIDLLFVIGILPMNEWDNMLDKMYATETATDLKNVLSELALILEECKEDE